MSEAERAYLDLCIAVACAGFTLWAARCDEAMRVLTGSPKP